MIMPPIPAKEYIPIVKCNIPVEKAAVEPSAISTSILGDQYNSDFQALEIVFLPGPNSTAPDKMVITK